MAGFDPDKYLAEKQSGSFDPDQYLAEKGSKTSGNGPSLAEMATKGVKAALKATKEAGTPPLTLEDAAKAFSPETGQFGASIPLQEAGEEVAKAAPRSTEWLGGLRASDVPSGLAQAAAGEALAPVFRAVGKPIAKAMGGLSGAGDVIGKVGADPSLLVAPGSAAADYSAPDAVKATSALLGEKSPKALIDAAEEAAKKGTLSAAEALEARKEVGRLFESKTITGEAQRRLYGLFDKIAKSDPLIAEADRTFARGKIADVARSPLPLNASGKPASLKSLVMGGSLGAGTHHPVASALGLGAFSPLIQSTLAAGAGLADEKIPALLVRALQAREEAGAKPATISDALAAALKNIRKEK